jgi:hypothetical protein
VRRRALHPRLSPPPVRRERGAVRRPLLDPQRALLSIADAKGTRLSQATDSLLKHEQGHFDLAELVKRENLEKLKNKFYEKQFSTRGKNEDQRKQFAREDSGKMIADEVQRLEVILSQRRKEYDEQTNFGQNLEKQSEYNSIFDKLKL